MDACLLELQIARRVEALRKEFPAIEQCRAHLGSESPARDFSVGLDIRLPQCQLLICGSERHDALSAVDAAFDEARARLTGRRR